MQIQIRLLLKGQSDQDLHCLPLHSVFKETTALIAKIRPRKYGIKCSKFYDISSMAMANWVYSKYNKELVK